MKALVTGGTRGAGLEMVKRFSQLDIPTIFTGRKDSEIKKIESEIPQTKGFALDLANPSTVNQLTNEIKTNHPDVNILIHNAGYLSTHHKESLEHVQKLFMVNTISPIQITQELLPNLISQKEGHVVFFSPPYRIDEKVRYLTPYMQSKLAQTTYMKSVSYLLRDKPISVNSIWTYFPLWTDAIRLRGVGRREQCMHPSIMASMIEQIIHEENPTTFKGHELIDKHYLPEKNINLSTFQLGAELEPLDSLFLKRLKKT